MRSQLLTDESGEIPQTHEIHADFFERLTLREKALKLGYTVHDARLFGLASMSATWRALLEAHDTSDSRLCPAECDARKHYADTDTESQKVKRIEREKIAAERKIEKIERKKQAQAKREADIATSLREVAMSHIKPLVTYWLDTRNGVVLYQRPTAIQEPKFYVQLKNKTILDKYLAHAAAFGRKEAVAIYGSREVLVGVGLPAKKSELDIVDDTRHDYIPEDFSHFPIMECERFPHPEKWTEKLTRRELLVSNCCKPGQLNNLPDGGCFVDTLGRRWWKVVSLNQFSSFSSKERVMYCR